MSRRKDRGRTPGLWIATNELPATGGHPFYQRLNHFLDAHGFDDFVEAQCAPFYAATVGRPSVMPGTYFRLRLIGYFEGIDSERGIAWRTADLLALRGFLGLGLDQMPPEHSTISRTRRLIDLETHRAVFTWILQVLATADLVTGKTIGIDATTLEANAALRSIVRRDSGETYQEFLTRLAQASGIETPTRADLARLDRTRPKKGRNTEWRYPHDPDARITKMKDGRTHLAHKAEHAVDLATGAIVGVTVPGADQGDTTTIAETVTVAAEALEAVATATDGHTVVIDEVVADKGYHSNPVRVDLRALDLRTYIAEPARGRRKWTHKAAARRAGGGAVGGYNLIWISPGERPATIDGRSRTSLIVDPVDGQVLPMTPEARQRMAALLETRARPDAAESDAGGPPSQYDAADTRPLAERCILGFGSTSGPPTLPNYFYNNLKLIVQTDDWVVIYNEMVHDTRFISMGGERLPPHVTQWLGDSVGHWEGDTLVVETTNFTDKTRFRGSGESLKVTEHFTLADDQTILYRFTIEDPSTWERSWTGEYPWNPSAEPMFEYACHEGNYALETVLRGARAADAKAKSSGTATTFIVQGGSCPAFGVGSQTSRSAEAPSLAYHPLQPRGSTRSSQSDS